MQKRIGASLIEFLQYSHGVNFTKEDQQQYS